MDYLVHNLQPGPVTGIDCSICIANFNGVDMIDGCLNSVTTQSFTGTLEIIIHDDCSTDDSVAHILAKYPDVILLQGLSNRGFCESNNRMVRHAHGKYVLLLNNDAELVPNALDSLLTYASRVPEAGILGLAEYDYASGSLVDRGYFFDVFLFPVPNLRESERCVLAVTGGALWIERAFWNEIGGFPVFFESVAEDIYLCCVARLAGKVVHVIPQSGFRHRIGHNLGGGKIAGNQLKTTFRRRALSERNRLFCICVCYPAPFHVLMLAVCSFALIVEGVVLASVSEPKLLGAVYMPALRALYSERRRLMALRQRVQRLRKVKSRSFFRRFTLIPRKLVLFLRHGLPAVS